MVLLQFRVAPPVLPHGGSRQQVHLYQFQPVRFSILVVVVKNPVRRQRVRRAHCLHGRQSGQLPRVRRRRRRPAGFVFGIFESGIRYNRHRRRLYPSVEPAAHSPVFHYLRHPPGGTEADPVDRRIDRSGGRRHFLRLGTEGGFRRLDPDRDHHREDDPGHGPFQRDNLLRAREGRGRGRE